ncbi:hypothetical protein [Clostridium tagluense]|uniref:Uncharacterized protein n=1 Tax=Clostridium tagluense TaxID=360422 RepID=A0A401UJL5_9CLOT|nr:hypothetical protein [Clostridium tagluense]GCD09750.1 hypothetical protein Ctaglu_13730 [Clostridium tagluense]
MNFGEGNVILDNVKVDGVTVTNIGANSLHIKGNSSIGLLTIEDINNDAHIVVEDNASVANASVYSGATIEVANGAKNAKPFANVTIASKNNDDVTLSGTFDNINITSPAKVTLAENTKIKNQIKITASVELNVSKNASVAKVDISTGKAEDKVILNGNLANVNVSSAANIEVKSGDVKIAANTNVNVKVKVDASATVTTGKGSDNIQASGDGKIVENKNLSDESKVKELTFDNYYIDGNTQI